MWEQYAEDHAGVCLVFDRGELLDALRRDLARKGAYWEGPVIYTVAGFADSEAGVIMLEHFNEQSLEDDVGRHVTKYHEDFFFLKTEDWATEFEYRFVWQRAEETPLARLLPSTNRVRYGEALRWVVVGERFPDWQIPGAREIAQGAGAELRRMIWEDSRPFITKAL